MSCILPKRTGAFRIKVILCGVMHSLMIISDNIMTLFQAGVVLYASSSNGFPRRIHSGASSYLIGNFSYRALRFVGESNVSFHYHRIIRSNSTFPNKEIEYHP